MLKKIIFMGTPFFAVPILKSLYFILSTLNKLNIDKIRNNIILKTFPLKV